MRPVVLMGPRRLVRLSAGTRFPSTGAGAEAVDSAAAEPCASELPDALRRQLAMLPMDSTAFRDAMRCAGPLSMAWAKTLGQLGALEEVLVDEHGDTVLRLARPDAGPPAAAPVAEGPAALADGAYLRFAEPECLLMSSSSSAVVFVPARHLPLLAAALCDGGSQVPLAAAMRALLHDNAFPIPRANPTAAAWSFPDRLFHAVSTHGRGYEGGYGATWPGLGRAVTARPASPSPRDAAADGVALARDDGGPLGADLGTVLARRRSCRAYVERTLSLAELAPLLHRALHTQRRQASKGGLQVAFHPYPSGGACDEMTTLVALRCTVEQPREPFVAIYSNHAHRLLVMPGSDKLALLLLRQLAAAGEVEPLPPAALVFVADYGRMAMKYEAIAYATTLRNVGAIYQTVSLVAEALGLGSCAVGGGWGEVERALQAGAWPDGVVVGGMLLGWPDRGT